eukprot:Pgem_evm1s11993
MNSIAEEILFSEITMGGFNEGVILLKKIVTIVLCESRVNDIEIKLALCLENSFSEHFFNKRKNCNYALPRCPAYLSFKKYAEIHNLQSKAKAYLSKSTLENCV